MKKKKLIKVSTVPVSLDTFCEGQLRMLSEYYEVVAVSSPGEALQRLSEREGVRAIAVPMERHIALWRDLRSLVAMVRVFRKERPDIVHSMTPKAGLLSMLAAWLCRVPVRMHTYTGLVFPSATGLKQSILIWMDRLLCACATYVNPEGQGVANDLRTYGITRKPLHIIGNGNVRGIDLDYWKPAGHEAVHAPFTFCFVGRLVGDKGINELVAAFRQLCQDGADIRLVLVGSREDQLDPLAAETLREIEHNSRIVATGPQRDVRPYYEQADAFVFPSYREGFPNTVLEAGAMGLPSIVTNINGCNEIIVEGENGVIIPPRDTQALYQAMKYFLENPVIVKGMGNQAHGMIAQRYEQKQLWAELLKTYQRLETEN